MTYMVSAAALSAWIVQNESDITPPPPPPPVATAQPLGIGGPWTLKFEDTFRGPTIDPAKWTAGWFPNTSGLSNSVGAAELQGYDAKQVKTGSAGLSIAAEKRPMTQPNGVVKQYASGLISSNGLFQFTFGVAEARIYTPLDASGNIGNWPAFWLDGQNWPVDGEIDVLEGLGGKPSWNLHTPHDPSGNGSWPLKAGWHTYSVWWEAGDVTFYFDGNNVGRVAYDRNSPNYLILNYAVGSYGGAVMAPATMLVDYVRVWQ